MNILRLTIIITITTLLLTFESYGQCVTFKNVKTTPKIIERKKDFTLNFDVVYYGDENASRGYAYVYLSKDKILDKSDISLGSNRFWRATTSYKRSCLSIDSKIDQSWKYILITGGLMCDGKRIVTSPQWFPVTVKGSSEEPDLQKADHAIQNFKCLGTGSIWSRGENIPTIRNGQTLNTFYDISNIGNKNGSGGEMRFYLSSNSENKVSRKDEELWPPSLFSSISAGRIYAFQPTMQIPTSYSSISKVYYLKAKTVLNDNSESNEANNFAKCKIFIYASGSSSTRSFPYSIELGRENYKLRMNSELMPIEKGLEQTHNKVRVIHSQPTQIKLLIPEWYLQGEISIYNQASMPVYKSKILNTIMIINSSELQNQKGLFIIRITNDGRQETVKAILP